MKLLADHILVKIDLSNKKRNGIIVNSDSDSVHYARVVQVSPLVREVKKDDTIIIPKLCARRVILGGEVFYLVQESDVMIVREKEE